MRSMARKLANTAKWVGQSCRLDTFQGVLYLLELSVDE